MILATGRIWWQLLFLLSFFIVGPWLTISLDYKVASSHLRVSVRRESLQDTPSCQHRIIQLELLNVHTSEDVVVKSIRTLDESTEALDREGDVSNRFDDLPRQLYASKVTGDSLRLGPGQVVIVPVAFLPRFPPQVPSLDDTVPVCSNQPVEPDSPASKRIPRASPFQEADWWDLLLEVGDSPMKASAPRLEPYRRNNMYSTSPQPSPNNINRYQVTTDILVEYDRGDVKLPLTITSRRENQFGLPDVIYFDTQEGDGLQSSVDEDSGRENRASRKGEEASHKMNHQQARNLNVDVKVNDGYMGKNTMSSHSGMPTHNPLLASTSERQISQDFDSKMAILPHFGSNTEDDRHKKGGIAWIVSSQQSPEFESTFDETFTVDEYPQESTFGQRAGSRRSQRQVDCFDVFLQNPKNSLLKVTEVIVSKPDAVSLHIRHEKARSNNKQKSGPITPQRVISNWSALSPTSAVFGEPESALLVAAGGEPQYIVTICAWVDKGPATEHTSSSAQGERGSSSGPQPSPLQDSEHTNDDAATMADWIDAGEESKSLGFLQIRTTDETHFVRLERANERMVKAIRSVSRDVSIGASACRLSEQSNSTRPTVPSGFLARHRYQDDTGNSSLKASLRLSPASIEFNFVSSSIPYAFQKIDVYNVSPRPIAIMRASVALEQRQNNSKQEIRWSSSEERKLLSKLGIKVIVKPLHDVLSLPIAHASFVAGAITVTCAIDWKKFKSHSLAKYATTLRGALVLRGTTRLDWSHSEWEKGFIVDSVAGHHIVTEIPITINILEGCFGFHLESTTLPAPTFWSQQEYSDSFDVVTGAFFPVNPHISHEKMTLEEEGALKDRIRGSDARMRVFSDFKKNVVVDEVTIVDGSRNEQYTNSFCSRFKARIVREPSRPMLAGKGQLPAELTDMGLLYLRYRFQSNDTSAEVERWTDFNSTFSALPTVCYLRVTTQPEFGIQEIPLVVYTGMIDVSRNLTDQATLPASDTEHWYNVMTGYDNLVDWFRNSKAGYALRSLLKVANEKPNRDGSILERYLYGLVPELDPSFSKLSPILLKIGAIAQGETETIPLTFTNFNPLPIGIQIVVGEVEGQSITIGRDVATGKGGDASLVDLLPTKNLPPAKSLIRSGRYRGHPVNGIRQFLATSKMVLKHLNQFSFRDDVSASKNAFSMFPFLREQFKSFAVAGYHRQPVPRRLGPSGWSRCDKSVHPPLYGPFQKKLTLPGRTIPGAIIISNDRKSVRSLTVCWDVESDEEYDGTYINVPPGAVVRFDVTIRSPPHDVLEKDITRFLATGLVLATDHGEVIPVLISFEALQGKLDVAHIPSVHQQNSMDGTIQVEAALFEKNAAMETKPIKVPPYGAQSFVDFSRGEKFFPRNASLGDNGISLFMKSSFLRDVYLRKIVSCNPWFTVDLTNETSDEDPFLGVNIGSVRSSISCDTIHGVHLGSTAFPSFYRCALSWLTQRAELQPRGCGSLPNGELQKECRDTDDYRCEKGGTEKMIRNLKHALLVSEWSDDHFSSTEVHGLKNYPFPVKSGRRGTDGFLSVTHIDAIANAWSALESATEAGLLSLGTSLRAVVQYNATPDELSPVKHNVVGLQDSNHLLSVAIRNISITTCLETPRLLMSESKRNPQQGPFSPHTVTFEPSLVGRVTYVKLPLRNPSAVPIRVRLAVSPVENVPDDGSVWSRFLGRFQTPYVQTRHKTSPTTVDLTHNHWWDRGGAFFLPDFHGDLIRSPYNITIKSQDGARISLQNPSLLANTAFLIGCGTRCGIRDETNNVNIVNRRTFEIPTLASKSLIGASAVAGESLVSREDALSEHGNRAEFQEQFVFAGGSLMSGGKGPAAFAIPYSALDEIIIPPFGEVEIGPILFRPPGRFQELGCESMKSNKKAETCESQNFESIVFIENSLTGLERVILQGKALWEKIVFLDPITEDGFSTIEQRNGLSTLMFPGYLTGNHGTSSRTRLIKEIVVNNEGDVAVTIARGYLSSITKVRQINREANAFTCEMSGFRLLGCRLQDGLFPFTISPGENRSIFVEYQPKCTKRREFVMLDLMLVSIEARSQDDSVFSEWPFGSPLLHQNRERRRSVHMPSLGLGLAIGYEMTNEEYSHCVPSPGFYKDVGTRKSKGKLDINVSAAVSGQFPEQYWISHNQTISQWLLYSVAVCFMTVWLFFHLQRLFWMLDAAKSFSGNLNLPKLLLSEATVSGQTWSTAFLCLVQADPSALELQSLALERSRQIVLFRYKSMGAIPPMCFSSTHQERAGSTVTSRRQVVNRGSQPSNADKIRTSDAIFGKLDILPPVVDGQFPIRLGWRIAATRGIVDASSLQSSTVVLKTEALLKQLKYQRDQPVPERIEAMTGRHTSEETKSLGSSTEFGSSLGDLSDEDDLPETTSPRPIILVPDSITTTALRSNNAVSGKSMIDIHVELNHSRKEQMEEERFKSLPVGLVTLNNDNPQEISFTTFPILEANTPTTEHTPALVESTGRFAKPRENDLNKQKPPIAPKVTISSPVVVSSRSKPNSKSEKFNPSTSVPSDDVPTTVESGEELVEEPPIVQPTDATPASNNTAVTNDIKPDKTEGTKQKRTKAAKSKREKAPTKKKPKEITVKSSTSNRQPSDEKDKEVQSESPSMMIRPPPGLLPPPGFEISQSNPFLPATDLSSPLSATEVDLLLLQSHAAHSASGADYMLVSGNASNTSLAALNNDTLLSSGGYPALEYSDTPRDPPFGDHWTTLPSLPSPQNGGSRDMADFDVMDFLDGILNDGFATNEDDDEATASAFLHPNSMVSDPVVATSAVDDHPNDTTANASSFIPSNNPWAVDASTSDGLLSSRAAAYGIAFDERTSNRILLSNTDNESNVPPLLMTAVASLQLSQESTSEGEYKESSVFYASLMDE